ncbi:GSU2403 family nucleotidyltransferase fold protein [Mesorhizobium sp. INR15]|uniref:nucleotidyltransferase family protein n=1 Tax=Mesorhizobium sp. INR15 TaxID=2654248 RepID=UPI0018967C9F|nr:GSU2403 family nucleotidyltransferase fold protein [Mesorhizobium sp. INR15]QPC91877.1 hypothetical protein GA829_15500 [Mesorhizobium sp. INR15]
MKDVDIVYRTMFAELDQRTFDAAFTSDFSSDGIFVRQKSKNQEFWYFQTNVDGKPVRKYVGSCANEEISNRVKSFKDLKNDLKSRRKLVSTLVRNAYLPAPERFTGDVVAALSDAGLFRLRGVLVGTVAYQCYPGLLGVRLPSTAMQTGDADFAQFHSISAAVEDSLPPILDVLKAIDSTFRDIPHQSDNRFSTQFENAKKFKVEFLTPNTGSDEHSDRAARMPALGGAAAQPLRFLDFLIQDPVRTVMLHKSGVPVTLPAPERYAVHKLIVSTRRRKDASGYTKLEKDTAQAASLIEALVQTRRHVDLAMAFAEAWNRGTSWREGISIGLSYIGENRRLVEDGFRRGLIETDQDPANFGLK